MTDHGGLSNDLADWYPVIAATGVPTPRTIIVPAAESLIDLFLDGSPIDSAGKATVQAVEAAIAQFDGPVFLRTGEMSAKHS
jgi:hypothetical protein